MQFFRRILHLVFVDVNPRVHENVIHLHKYKDHVEHWVDAQKNLPRNASLGNFKKEQKFKAGINQSSQAKKDSTDTQNQAPVVFLIF